MKKLLSVAAVAVALAFSGNAFAGQCPMLIKQIKDANVPAAKKAQVDKLVAEAEKLHADGKHADSVKKAEDAAKVAGVELKKKS